MATVRPFPGITYEPTRVPDLGLVACPPYDVISDADRDELYERHPYNMVRIVSGRDESGDGDAENKYTRACGFFRSWLWEGELREDHDPALYVYRQSFADPTGATRRVWGLICTISLDDPILAHEKTMAGPKADRLALMKEVPANLSPIYALYSQGPGGIAEQLSAWTHESPVADFVDAEGVRHTAWAAHDAGFHDKVAAALADKPLLIADGHHRFETAKRYRELRSSDDGPGAWDHTMALLVDAAAQPVLILPYHRIVRNAARTDVLDVLRERFSVEELGAVDEAGAEDLGRALWADDPPFVAFIEGNAYRMRPLHAEPDEIPAAVLARAALEPLGASDAEASLTFTPSAAEVWQASTDGAVCGFLIPPVGADRVWDLAERGVKMPEKSTYFFPKPRDGIVIRALEPCGPA
jgi:uncharacterized protein (DUF1015 family)